MPKANVLNICNLEFPELGLTIAPVVCTAGVFYIFGKIFLMKPIFILLLFSILGCNTNPTQSTAVLPTHKSDKTSKTEDFGVFNKKFHSDTIFQLDRIKFPLEGGYADGFERGEWTKDNWEYLKSPLPAKDLPEEYKQKVTYSDTLVTEKIWIENSGFSTERHFKVINDKWYLVYCLDKNL